MYFWAALRPTTPLDGLAPFSGNSELEPDPGDGTSTAPSLSSKDCAQAELLRNKAVGKMTSDTTKERVNKRVINVPFHFDHRSAFVYAPQDHSLHLANRGVT